MMGSFSQSFIPPALRWGAAFIVMGLALFLAYGMTVVRGGVLSTYTVTLSFVLMIIAAGVVGYFFVVGEEQRASVTRLGALGSAVAVIVAVRFVPQIELLTFESGWLVAYGVASCLAGIVLRRRVTNG